jgi:hypothetical protein
MISAPGDQSECFQCIQVSNHNGKSTYQEKDLTEFFVVLMFIMGSKV